MEQPVYSNEPGEAELAYLLAGWRDEVRQAPMSTVVTPRDAAIALDRATSTERRATQRRRFSLAVVGSVAAAVLCLGGFGSVVYGAGPGDPLYGVRTMLFGEQQATRDDQVALAAQTQMAQVEQLIAQGDWAAAQNKLQTLTTTVAAVGDTDRQQELVDQWQQLSVKVETRDPNATVPPDAPPVVLPEVPSDLPLPVLLAGRHLAVEYLTRGRDDAVVDRTVGHHDRIAVLDAAAGHDDDLPAGKYLTTTVGHLVDGAPSGAVVVGCRGARDHDHPGSRRGAAAVLGTGDDERAGHHGECARGHHDDRRAGNHGGAGGHAAGGR